MTALVIVFYLDVAKTAINVSLQLRCEALRCLLALCQ